MYELYGPSTEEVRIAKALTEAMILGTKPVEWPQMSRRMVLGESGIVGIGLLPSPITR